MKAVGNASLRGPQNKMQNITYVEASQNTLTAVALRVVKPVPVGITAPPCHWQIEIQGPCLPGWVLDAS